MSTKQNIKLFTYVPKCGCDKIIKISSLPIVMFVTLVFTAAMVTSWLMPDLKSDEQITPEIIEMNDLPDTDTDAVIFLVNKTINMSLVLITVFCFAFGPNLSLKFH